jgi:PAS domain S-box-containing protein
MTKPVKTIVVIDDCVDDLEVCVRILSQSQRYDYTIIADTNPLSAVARLKGVDCAIIDYQFPSMTGLALLKKIKMLYPSLPVIVLTGQVKEEIAVELLKSGAADYINKADLLSIQFDNAVANAIDSMNTSSVVGSTLLNTAINVLVIDDNVDDLELCERLLKKFGSRFNVSSNTHTDNLCEQIRHNDVDCVVLDYSMPGRSGLEVLKEVMDQLPYVAVVMMTGQGNEKVAVDAIKNGAENYLIKGQFSSDLLHSSIVQAVDKKRLEKHLLKKEADLQESRMRLQDSHNFLQLILRNMKSCIFVKDSQYRIVEANEAFLELYPEQSRGNVIGTTTLEDYDEKEAEAFLAMDKLAFEQGQSQTLECVLFPDGKRRTLFTTKTKFANSYNETFILCVATDVTERENLISQLQKSNADLEDFAYVASHDLKSPLNAICKLINWIDEDYSEQLPEQVKEYFSLIEGRAGRMSRLLEDLLQYSRVQKDIANTDLVNVKDVEEELRALVDDSKTLRIHIKGDNVRLPKIALKIVLINLINNAIKHHDKNHVVVDITVKKSERDYFISIADDGPGILPQYKEKIFEMFQTLKPRDQVEGSGMGLAMVKKVLNYYQGDIVLEPSSDRGATFSITWPLIAG